MRAMESRVWDGMNAESAFGGDPVEGVKPEQFLEAQYRKTELRRLYRDNAAADRVSKLMRAIEQDVIPRLVWPREPALQPSRPASDPAVVNSARVARFAQILLGHDTSVEPSSFVGEVRAGGVSVEHVYLNLLAPAARHVGALWDDDRCTFFDVTMALGTLHRIMLSLSDEFRFAPRRIDPARRILLLQPPGGEHTFGLQMVAEFFKRGAWTVDMLPSPTDDGLGRAVRADWFTVVGFSVACDPSLDDLAATIRMVRQASSNPKVGILVGGPAFLDHPDHVARVGADGMAADAIHAVLEAERFVLDMR